MASTGGQRVRSTARLLAQLAPRDHRYVGLKQKLFIFNDSYSQGSCFFLPRGAHIYNKLVEYLRHEYKRRHYQEVITPNMFSTQLWQESGHWNHYKDNMIRFKVHERDYSLKPMNCPAHCVMFKQSEHARSVDELPVRWADFGVLHRNELSGSLIGLTRVRRFQQDDAHIFCTPQQMESEVSNCLDFARQVYEQFDFTFDIKLSLRPQHYMGDSKLWDKAEESLRAALRSQGISWEEEKYEGAFYGPKIDLVVRDTRQRAHQCATIQLDFQLPERFQLVYRDSQKVASLEGIEDASEGAGSDKGLKRPVIIHRAILGSLERFIAMVAENTGGRWPFWLSPLQVQVVPVSDAFNAYAMDVASRLRSAGLWADCDTSLRQTMQRKLREAELLHYNLIAVVGERERASGRACLRLKSAPSNQSTSPQESTSQPITQLDVDVDKLAEMLVDFGQRRVSNAAAELLSKQL